MGEIRGRRAPATADRMSSRLAVAAETPRIVWREQVSIMKVTTKLFHVIIWLPLTLAGFNLLAARNCSMRVGSYSRKITTDSPEASVISIRASRSFTDSITVPSAHFSRQRKSIRNAQWRTGGSRSPVARI